MASLESLRVFSLLEVCQSIQRTLSARYGSTFWVRAEMNKLNFYPASGHCFPDLLQKEGNEIVAQMRSVLWKSDFDRINRRFLEVVKEPLREGIEMVFEARIQYEPRHGLSLRIVDIDPTYVLGTLERERLACVRRLQAENIWSRNQALSLPWVPNRIAVISSQTSKGFSDFIQVLSENPWEYTFHVELFSALLQGEEARDSLLAALHRIEARKGEFDAVALIRGGGDEVGLNVYNHYELARAVCLFPLPILTGIGHSTNLTVCEEVAFFHGITPTQIGNFLLERCRSFDEQVQDSLKRLATASRQCLQAEKARIERFGYSWFRASLQLHRENNVLDTLVSRLRRAARIPLKTARLALETQEKAVEWADPARMLRMGYSLAYRDGKIVGSVAGLLPGESLQIRMQDGQVESRVEEVRKENPGKRIGGTKRGMQD